MRPSNLIEVNCFIWQLRIKRSLNWKQTTITKIGRRVASRQTNANFYDGDGELKTSFGYKLNKFYRGCQWTPIRATTITTTQTTVRTNNAEKLSSVAETKTRNTSHRIYVLYIYILANTSPHRTAQLQIFESPLCNDDKKFKWINNTKTAVWCLIKLVVLCYRHSAIHSVSVCVQYTSIHLSHVDISLYISIYVIYLCGSIFSTEWKRPVSDDIENVNCTHLCCSCYALLPFLWGNSPPYTQ